LDVCEIGEQVGYTGQVKQVKALGVMALLDEGNCFFFYLSQSQLENSQYSSRCGNAHHLTQLFICFLLGETDWKVIVIDINDPLASKLNDIEDVERHLPGFIRATNEWFRIYKIPDGKPENQFAFSGEAKNKKYATDIIKETHEAWERLIKGDVPAKAEAYDIKVSNVSVEGSPYKVTAEDDVVKSLPTAAPKTAAPIDPSVDKWFFISGTSNL